MKPYPSSKKEDAFGVLTNLVEIDFSKPRKPYMEKGKEYSFCAFGEKNSMGLKSYGLFHTETIREIKSDF